MFDDSGGREQSCRQTLVVIDKTEVRRVTGLCLTTLVAWNSLQTNVHLRNVDVGIDIMFEESDITTCYNNLILTRCAHPLNSALTNRLPRVLTSAIECVDTSSAKLY